MDFHHLRYEMNVKIQSIVLVLTRTKLRKQFCHCARSISRRVRSRTWTAIRSLSYSTLSLGITRFWNFSNPLSGCKVTKFDPPLPPRRGARGVKKFEGVKYWPQRGQYLLSNTFGIIAIAQTSQKLLNLNPLAPLRGARGVKKILGGEKIWGDKFWGHTSFGIFQIRWKTQICEANLCFPIFTNSSSLAAKQLMMMSFIM